MKLGIVGYCAGLLEGEGSFGFHENGIVIQCSMTDLEPLQVLKKYLGGSLTGPYKDKEAHHKQSWKWTLARRKDVVRICRLLYKFMSPRRKRRIEELLLFNRTQPKKLRDKAAHGTIGMYGNHKCRCYRCRRVWKQYMKQWRSKCA